MRIRILKYISFFSGLVFTLAFLTPFFIDKGLSTYEIMLMQSIYMAAITLLEVPSGIFSDRYGRKLTLVIAFSAYLMAWIILLFANNFLSALPYQIFFALGVSFQSGTYTAYIFEASKADGAKEDFRALIAHINSYKLYGMVISSLAGVTLYKIGGFTMVLIATAISASAALLLTILLPKQNNDFDTEPVKNIKDIILTSISIFGKTKLLALTSIENILYGAAIGTFSYFNMIMLKENGFPVQFNGYYLALMFFLSAFVLKRLSNILIKEVKDYRGITWISVLISVFVLFVCYVKDAYLTAVLWLLIAILNHLRTPFAESILNNQLENQYRATVLSCVSLGRSLLGMLLAPIFGFIYDSYNGKLIIATVIILVLTVNVSILHHCALPADKQA